MFEPVPFKVEMPDSAIADLRARLRNTRWPEAEPVDDWSQGVPLAYVQELAAWWADEYDMGLAGRMNKFPQAKVSHDGLGIHSLHAPSPEPNALPIVLTHGWPGSVVEFLDVIGPLSDPRKHGGDPADAFHVVVPSLPGYGWSDKPANTGWGIERIASAWHALMTGLGYARYVAQGRDWGAAVTTVLAQQAPDGLLAIHLNMPTGRASPGFSKASAGSSCRRASPSSPRRSSGRLADGPRRTTAISAGSTRSTTAAISLLSSSPSCLSTSSAEAFDSFGDRKEGVTHAGSLGRVPDSSGSAVDALRRHQRPQVFRPLVLQRS
jgi:pimeloyl-ACP methyl ester carboxylesterase